MLKRAQSHTCRVQVTVSAPHSPENVTNSWYHDEIANDIADLGWRSLFDVPGNNYSEVCTEMDNFDIIPSGEGEDEVYGLT